MAIKLIRIHETEKGFIEQGEKEFLKRLQRFTNIEIISIQAPKKWNQLSETELKKVEAEKLLNEVQPNDTLILLDEKGKHMTSTEFARFIDYQLAIGGGNLIFCIGGAFGFDELAYQRANHKLSLSKMTTTHQLVRLLFIEQLYRAFTILNNHPYHNE